MIHKKTDKAIRVKMQRTRERDQKILRSFPREFITTTQACSVLGLTRGELLAFEKRQKDNLGFKKLPDYKKGKIIKYIRKVP